MAEVWRGRHTAQGVEIAVKVITADLARDARLRGSFSDEVRAVAALSHPAIVTVLDHGEVTAEAEKLSGGRMVAGSPYLAMELASGGSLHNVSTVFPWDMLKMVLLALLDGLAHAHARGVIHRDLKPANVLMASPGDVRPGLKLTDFGLAHALSAAPSGSTSHAAGTPQYMSPEQFEGRWRDFGPWTDLYALGCLAWELASGVRPFDGADFKEILKAHRAGPPEFPSPPGLPRGFESWLRRLLRRDAHERFQTSADAASALHSLDESGIPVSPSSEMVALQFAEVMDPPTVNDEPVALAQTWKVSGHSFVLGLTQTVGDSYLALPPPASDEGPAVEASSRPLDSPPVLPVRWQREEEPISMQLAGAGLGLFGLRTIPLVARQAERDAIWESLLDVHGFGQARVVHLYGSAGVGKTRIAQWMCERAHELGGALCLRGTHSPMGGPGDGLSRMMARHLRCVGLSHDEVVDRCRTILTAQGVRDEYEWYALAQLIAPVSSPAGGPGVNFRTPEQRYVLIRRLVERLSRERPVIVWLDDAQWGHDSLRFVHYLMKTQGLSPTRVLFLLSTQDESLGERALEQFQLQEILQLPGARSLSIGPLGDLDHATLVEELLGLDGDLAQTVRRRTAGNPLFAVQLVGDWVERGVLEPRPDGFALRSGADAAIPDDIHALVGSQLSRLLEGSVAADRHSLELAAALGQNVDHAEWQAAGAMVGVEVSSRLIHELVRHRLAVSRDVGWAFTHNMLRESLVRTAQEQRRWRGHNRACARMLQQRYSDAPELVAGRLGRYLLHAGETREALHPLMAGVQSRTERSESDLALELVGLYEDALTSLGAPLSSAAWGEAAIRRALCHLEEGDFPAADDATAAAEAQAIEHGWDELLPEIRRVRGHVLRNVGSLDGAKALFGAAMAGFAARGDRVKVAGCLRGLGFVANQEGEIALARELIGKAYRECADEGGEREAADCLQVLGIVAKKCGEYDVARSHAQSALEIYERIGYLRGQAHCHNGLAEVARYTGDYAAAERGYRDALRLHEALGGDASVPRLNLGLVLIRRGRYPAARRELEEVRAACERTGRRQFEAAAHSVLLPCYAAGGVGIEFDHACSRAAEILGDTNFVDADIAWPAQMAGDIWARHGEAPRAKSAWRLSLGQWVALGDTQRALEVRWRLDEGVVQ
jgi:serine/threonine protein kinase/tetratricopeptide (TPR) repeat protein